MIRSPSKQTLRRYGLTYEYWLELLSSQSYCCPICHRQFSEELRPVVDHYHQKNYKKLKPEQKRKYIRGLTCAYDNQRILVKGITLAKAKATVEYLERFEAKLLS